MSAGTSAAPAAVTAPAWHQLTTAEAADELAVSIAQGLGEDQVHQRREVSGLNTLPEPNRRSRLMLLVDQVRNPLVLLCCSGPRSSPGWWAMSRTRWSSWPSS